MCTRKKQSGPLRKTNMSSIVVVINVAGKLIQELPILPDPDDLLSMKVNSVKKHPGRTIERLASTIFNRFVGKSNYIFDIKELRGDRPPTALRFVFISCKRSESFVSAHRRYLSDLFILQVKCIFSDTNLKS